MHTQQQSKSQTWNEQNITKQVQFPLNYNIQLIMYDTYQSVGSMLLFCCCFVVVLSFFRSKQCKNKKNSELFVSFLSLSIQVCCFLNRLCPLYSCHIFQPVWCAFMIQCNCIQAISVYHVWNISNMNSCRDVFVLVLEWNTKKKIIFLNYGM